MANLPSAVTLALERHQNTPHHLAHQAFLGGTLLTPAAKPRLRRLSPAAKILILLRLDELPSSNVLPSRDECPIAVNQL
jgi:hypothetical protein